MVSLHIQCVCIDTRDPSWLSGFWQAALGWRRTHETGDLATLKPPTDSLDGGLCPDLLILRVPEARADKSNLHLHLQPDDQAAKSIISRNSVPVGGTRSRIGCSAGPR